MTPRPPRPPRLPAVAAGIASLSCLACAALPGRDPPAPPSPPFSDLDLERVWPLAPGASVEANLELFAGHAVEATFSSDGADLAWNVHSHHGARVVHHQQGRSSGGAIHFVPERDGVYSFMWTHRGAAPAELRVAIRGRARLHSFHP